MTITDREWEQDVQNVAEKLTGFILSKTTTLEDIIFNAWKGTLRSRLPDAEKRKFDTFFERYVHDVAIQNLNGLEVCLQSVLFLRDTLLNLRSDALTESMTFSWR